MRVPTANWTSTEVVLADDTVYEGGHFIIGEPLDEPVLASWSFAVESVALSDDAGYTHVGLRAMIGDLAVPANERAALRGEPRLPPIFVSTLSRFAVDPARVEVVLESQLRNRSHGDMRSRLRDAVERDEDGYHVVCFDGSRRRLTRGTVPVCNLIMARSFADRDREYGRSVNFHDLRWECQNEGGVVVSRRLYRTGLRVENVYLTRRGLVAFTNEHQLAS